MNGPLFSIPAFINRTSYVKTLVDGGSESYGLIDARVATKLDLPRLPVRERGMIAFNKPTGVRISEVAYCSLDIAGHHQSRVFFYVVPQLFDHGIILGRPWLQSQDAYIDPKEDALIIRRSGVKILNTERLKSPEICQISAVAFTRLAQGKFRRNTTVFAASMADIAKALAVKKYTDPRTKLPAVYFPWLDAFDRKKADTLPPLRGPGIDHAIELEKDTNGKEPVVPWGPLYSLSREELLVLRKTLTDYLDKGFIRVSNSPAAAPILFAKKPGGGLRFCVDYRALNRITKKDRYPLPLIRETLNNISQAKWFTKLDVIAAFHKIRIAQGDEWKTAFRTRYGLYEWLVTPFGLANGPSTFQKYINWTLRDFLDDFVSAYIDDILIYTNGSRLEHEEQVKKVLAKLQAAGLQIDIDKCEFSVKSTKYLGFIIEAGKGIHMDPKKVQAILEWEAPKSVQGVQSFLGFANFYRRFIRSYSEIVTPLTALTKKEVREEGFSLTPQALEAFEKLKEAFTTAPVLTQFDPDRDTVLETDASGWVTAATLSQYGNDGVLHPCAFYSRKMAPAECNYEIHDKEMLAIIRALEEWDAELRSLPQFLILTDHKNLEYFMTMRKLNERQIRWSQALTRYNFTLQYRPGKLGGLPDSLTRRPQDLPSDEEDERVQYRQAQLIKPEHLQPTTPLRTAPVAMETTQQSASDDETQASLSSVQTLESETGNTANTVETQVPTAMEALWCDARGKDKLYERLCLAVRERKRSFPPELGVRVSIADCTLDDEDNLRYRDRLWVPDAEPLRTRLVQTSHDSYLTGHPGREGLLGILRRKYFWPGMDECARRFTRNCYSCGGQTVWRDRKKGLLRPLPIPEQQWQELSIDYITDLPKSNGYTNILVVTDRLGKGVIFAPCKDLSASTLADTFIREVIRHHALPRAITSDRGSQIVKGLWKQVCKRLDIEQRISTAYHPETDGATERANQVLEEYLRHFTSYFQEDWYRWLPLAQIAINSRNAASSGISPFFLSHGFNPRLGDGLDLEPLALTTRRRSPQEMGEAIAQKIRQVVELAQTLMAATQQRQEDITNRKRDPAPSFQVGDKVWLDLRNIKTDRPCKKLADKHAQFTVIKVISGSAYRLNTPPGISNVFHVSLLRPVAQDPLPSQIQSDYQPPLLINDDEDDEDDEDNEDDDEEWWQVEKILKERTRRGRGRGGPLKSEVLVKWTRFLTPTWVPREKLKDTPALAEFEREKTRHNEDKRGGNVTGSALPASPGLRHRLEGLEDMISPDLLEKLEGLLAQKD